MRFKYIRGRIILRDDNGPNSQIPSKEEEFLEVDGKVYPLSRLTNTPPILKGQLIVTLSECLMNCDDVVETELSLLSHWLE